MVLRPSRPGRLTADASDRRVGHVVRTARQDPAGALAASASSDIVPTECLPRLGLTQGAALCRDVPHP